jgi:FkbM family methyltransferase
MGFRLRKDLLPIKHYGCLLQVNNPKDGEMSESANFIFSAVNAAGNRLPRTWRRFIVDRLKLGSLLNRVSSRSISEVDLPGGIRLFFNPLLHANAVDPSFHEPEVVAELKRRLVPGFVFYDIGANIGLLSFTAAHLFGPQGMVVAIEPGEQNLRYLRKTPEQDPGNVRLLEVAIGASDGELLFDRRGGAMSGTLVAEASEANDPFIVPARSLDSLAWKGHPQSDVIKIDIEGGEDAAPGGAMKCNSRGMVVISEMKRFSRDGISLALNALEELGYRILHLADRSAGKQSTDQFLAIPPDAKTA